MSVRFHFSILKGLHLNVIKTKDFFTDITSIEKKKKYFFSKQIPED